MRKLILRMDISEQAASVTGGELFKVFCECYRKENTFTVTDKELALEIFFEEELNAGIVEAISKLPFEYIKELRFSNVEDVVEEGVEESSMNIVTEEVESASEQSDEPADNLKSPEQGESKKTKAKKVPRIDEVGKTLLDKISKEATSFDDYVQKVIEFLNIKPYYREFATCVFEIASKNSLISWEDIQEAMKETGHDFSLSKQVAFTRAVKAKLDASGSVSRALTLISEVSKYRDFGFEVIHEEVHDDTSHDGVNHEEESQKQAKERPECTILSKELVSEAMRKNSYFDRVGCVFDRIRTDRFDDDTYADYRGRIVDTLVSAAADNSENPQMSANDCVFFFIGKNFSSNQAHVVRAMVFQSIKDYAHSRGYEGNAYTQHFLKDLRMLL